MTISKELLEKAGYRCWRENPSEYYVREYQKRIEDGNRVAFFINIKEATSFRGDDKINNFWPSIQFNIGVNGSDQSIHVELVQWFNEGGVYTGITIEEMENECREIWLKLEGKHYE